ncbi:hypothetical protein BN946_scf184845.g60 [Trametes cinnabarina]|uniref:Uncharacterized protein n=1 Tax=Pycnoporus cinnabarinus TaxID=5643 RepID=A0A060SA16_PYCCI|nr:hypothetical protein BN946_scf184845.g60 [Trametes cinnabarina]
MALPTSDNNWEYVRASAAAALSEVYPRKRVEKALDFVQLVRRQLAGRPAAYDHFFKALKLYEEGRVELVDVLLQLMILCASTPKLLQELNYFLPQGYSYQTSFGMPQNVELITPMGTVPHTSVATAQ